jgi:hypothetical protein
MTYFLYYSSFYDQMNRVSMCSPLAPVMANLYMQHSEWQAVSSAIKEPAHWYRYVVDILWCGHMEWTNYQFLMHLSKIPPSITFTMEVE